MPQGGRQPLASAQALARRGLTPPRGLGRLGAARRQPGTLNDHMARTLIHAPTTARKGEAMQIRTLIAHPMETGYRAGSDGRTLARDIIRRFTVRYNDEVVFSAELYPAIAANPYLAFSIVANASGTLSFSWEGDNGFSQTESAVLTVA